MRKLVFFSRLFVIGAVSLIVGCSALKESKLLIPTWFGMSEITPGTYASSDLPPEQRKALIDSIALAEKRVRTVYGDVVSTPKIYACSNQDCYESFGGIGDGRKIGRSGILLLPKSIAPAAISHEWSHVELDARIGGLRMQKVPMWFNEGLAVVVGEEPRHSEAVWKEAMATGVPVPSLSELQTFDQWLTAYAKHYKNPRSNPRDLNVVYAAAGHEVRSWYQRVGQSGLLSLIEALRNGAEFGAAYQGFAAKAVPKTTHRNLPFEKQAHHA